MADPVKLVGADTGLDVPPDLVQRPGGELAGDAHALDGLGVLDVALAEARRTAADVFRARDLGGHAALRRYPAGLEGSCHDLQV